MTLLFWVAFMLFVTLFSTNIGLYVDAMRSAATQNDKLVGVVGGTVIATALATLGLTLYAFGGNPTRLIQFLYVFALMVMLPTCTISAAISAQHLYGLREQIANKQA